MSCYLTTDAHLQFLVRALIRHGVIVRADATEVIRALDDMNRKAVSHAYPVDFGGPGSAMLYAPENHEIPGPGDVERMSGWTVKAIDRFVYQCCGYPGWAGSMVAEQMDALRTQVCRGLPGYEEAPW